MLQACTKHQPGTAAAPGAVIAGVEGLPCSVSESLAHGLVRRLANELGEESRQALRAAGLPTPRVKRAVAYRTAVDFHLRAIPQGLRVAVFASGDLRGKSKDSMVAILHWGRNDISDDHLCLQLTQVDARRVNSETMSLCQVTRHAVMRLFFRLRTTDQDAVMRELSDMAVQAFCSTPLLGALSDEAQVLVPSKNGAFALARNAYGFPPIVVKTWMSDERMQDNMHRLHAVRHARSEQNGLVVNLGPRFPIVSQTRLQAARRDGERLYGSEVINRVCDRQFDECSRLPAEWRFHEPLPEGETATDAGLGTEIDRSRRER